MRKLKLYFVFALSILAVVGCTKKQEIPTGSVVWKISGKGLKEPSYIIGTLHLLPVHYLDSIPGIKEAMNNTEQVIVEIAMGNMEENIKSMTEHIMMPEGVTYKDLLSEEDYNFLDEELKNWTEASVGLEEIGIFYPFQLNLLYSMSDYQKIHPELDFSNFESMDVYFQRIASENGKEVTGLETLQDQIELLYNPNNIKRDAEDLICLFKNKENSFKLQSDIDKYYFEGDLINMAKIMDLEYNPCPASKERKFLINKNRNDNWLKKLPAIMEEKPSLIAVGCLHISGEDGILYQLQEMGYTVKPVLK